MEKVEYSDDIHIIEKDGVCQVVVTTKVGGGAGGPLYLASSFDLADLLQTIIEKDPELFRKKVWKPLADKYGYPLKALTEGNKQGGMSSKIDKGQHSWNPPPPPPAARQHKVPRHKRYTI